MINRGATDVFERVFLHDFRDGFDETTLSFNVVRFFCRRRIENHGDDVIAATNIAMTTAALIGASGRGTRNGGRGRIVKGT